jgi:hypothetical protein
MQLRRILGPPAAIVVLAFASPPAALAANVNVRIEGQGATLLARTQVTTPAADVHGDGSCPGNTVAGALQVATGGNWDRAPGGFSTVILGETHTFSDGRDSDYWAGWVNDKYGDAFCAQSLQDGDDVLVTPDTTDNATFASAIFPLRFAGIPAVVPRGAQVEVRATEFRNYVGQPTFGTPGTGDPQPSTGVRISGGGADGTTGQDGKATVAFTEAGPATVRAVKPVTSPDGGAFAMRAVPQAVCVDDGAGSCGGPSTPGGGGGTPAAPTPYRSPDPEILSIRPGTRFFAKRAPRELRGRINLGTAGLTSVRLRLKRKAGGRCEYFSGRLEAFRRTRCGTGWSFAIGDRAEWSYLLPEKLAPGRYELDVFARDRTGERRMDGIVFYVRKGTSR